MRRVSVIIPVYNVARYLCQCLASVKGQTYSNLEVILVDDGSTDDSGKICDQYAEIDPRFQVVHQKNAGAANAKNAGLDCATGDFVTFIDSDDYVEQNWIERLVSAAEDYSVDVVECDFDRVYQSHTEVVNKYRGISVFTTEEYMSQYLSNWTCSLFWNKLFRRELLTEIRFRRERRCIDDEFFTYKVLTGAKKILRIPDVLYHYRQRASSAVFSDKNRIQITDDALEILVERYQWICRYFPSLRKTYLSHDVSIMLYFAKEFAFVRKTVRKFRKTALFYLKECLLHWCDKVTLIYVVRLQAIPLGLNKKATAEQTEIAPSDYFI